jgi:lysophospholipase L1-like esterase
MLAKSARRVAPLALLLAGAALAFGLLEVGLRLFGRKPELGSGWMLTNRYLVLDSEVIVMPRRLHEPDFYAVPPGRPLVLAIGDSYTAGFPVAPDAAYPAVLEDVLSRRRARVAVRNAGMGDSGPDQQLRLLEARLLPRLRPRVVVWQLYANDLWDNVSKAVYRLDGDRLDPVDASAHWIAIRQHIFDLTPLPRTVKKRSWLFQELLHATETFGIPKPGHGIERSLAKLARELDAFVALGRRHGFTPYVLLVPPQSLYLAPRDPDRWRAMWNVVDHERLVALVGARPDLIDGFLGTAHALDYFADGERDLAPLGDRHLNERGYGRLATVVARRLLRDGVLSDPGSAAARPRGAGSGRPASG